MVAHILVLQVRMLGVGPPFMVVRLLSRNLDYAIMLSKPHVALQTTQLRGPEDTASTPGCPKPGLEFSEATATGLAALEAGIDEWLSKPANSQCLLLRSQRKAPVTLYV